MGEDVREKLLGARLLRILEDLLRGAALDKWFNLCWPISTTTSAPCAPGWRHGGSDNGSAGGVAVDADQFVVSGHKRPPGAVVPALARRRRRRGPREQPLALAAASDGPEQVGYGQMTYDVRYGGGRALPIGRAEISIAGQRQAREVAQAAARARFDLELPAGVTELRTSFTGPDGLELGAYNVYVQTA